MLNKKWIIGLTTIFLMSTITISVFPVNAQNDFSGGFAIIQKATPLFGINLPPGQESPAFIQNVTQLAKMGFDSPQNAKLFLQLDSIALNSSSHAGNLTLTTPTIKQITSVYNQMKNNNSTGGFTEIATIAMQALDNKRSFFDGAGRNITVLPNSKDFGDILKFGTLGAQIGCNIVPNNRGDSADIFKTGQPCISGALGAASVKLITIS
jgi:hypothetical protein